MKILYHHRTLGDGAEGIHISEMVYALRSLGHEVRLVGPIHTSKKKKPLKNKRLQILKELLKGPFYECLEIAYNFYNFLYLKKIVLKFKPDLIYDRYITFNYSCVGFGILHNIPVFLEVNAPLAYERDHEKDESLFFKKLAYLLERYSCKHAAKTIVVSTPLKEYLLSAGVPSEKIVVVPNGVNTEKFYPISVSPNLLHVLKLGPEDFIIGFVGILRPWHGIEMLLEAFKQVKLKQPHVKLVLVGDGPIREAVEQKAASLGLLNELIITGRVAHERVSEYVALFDIAVSPKATFYASPMKILEYMAQRKTVVAPDKKNIRDLIKNEETGVLFEHDTPVSLANALLMLLNDPEKRNQIGVNALNAIYHDKTWQQNAQRIIEMCFEK